MLALQLVVEEEHTSTTWFLASLIWLFFSGGATSLLRGNFKCVLNP